MIHFCTSFSIGNEEQQETIIKQLLNSVLVGNGKLLRPRFVLSLSRTSALIIPHILPDLIQ